MKFYMAKQKYGLKRYYIKANTIMGAMNILDHYLTYGLKISPDNIELIKEIPEPTIAGMLESANILEMAPTGVLFWTTEDVGDGPITINISTNNA